MPYAVFPIDSLRRSYEPGYPKEFLIEPATVTAEFGTGAVRARPETSDAFRGWRCRIRNLLLADYTILDTTFYRVTVKRSVLPFEWTNPLTAETLVVRFWDKEPPRWEGVDQRSDLLVVQFALAECAGVTGVGYAGATT